MKMITLDSSKATIHSIGGNTIYRHDIRNLKTYYDMPNITRIKYNSAIIRGDNESFCCLRIDPFTCTTHKAELGAIYYQAGAIYEPLMKDFIECPRIEQQSYIDVMLVDMVDGKKKIDGYIILISYIVSHL